MQVAGLPGWWEPTEASYAAATQGGLRGWAAMAALPTRWRSWIIIARSASTLLQTVFSVFLADFTWLLNSSVLSCF